MRSPSEIVDAIDAELQTWPREVALTIAQQIARRAAERLNKRVCQRKRCSTVFESRRDLQVYCSGRCSLLERARRHREGRCLTRRTAANG